MSGAGFVTCPDCFKQCAPRWDGTVDTHDIYVGGDWLPCPGSYMAPGGPHVHRCRCGARWDEHVEDVAVAVVSAPVEKEKQA